MRLVLHGYSPCKSWWYKKLHLITETSVRLKTQTNITHAQVVNLCHQAALHFVLRTPFR